jgi:carboxyl-terminal processing protease
MKRLHSFTAITAALLGPTTAMPQSTQPARPPVTTATAPARTTYAEAFRDLYEHLGRRYPCFADKQIDWKKVGDDLLPRAAQAKNDSEFGLLCIQLVACLKDSHAYVERGSAQLPEPPLPRWDPGLACLLDDHERPAVFHVHPDGPAARAGVKPGMTILSVNGKPADAAIKECMQLTSTYIGYSSDRCLRYDAGHMFLRRHRRGEAVRLSVEELEGKSREFELTADLGPRYVPRLPVPIKGISDAAAVSWKRLENDIGYLYVRRINPNLPESLDRAIAELKGIRGLILDVRGNSGGGFDGVRALRNFIPDDPAEPKRPRYGGPIAMLIDERCISAGEGWASWFVANKRARLFGTTTAGGSSAKETYKLTNGLYQVTFAVRARRGFLDRPIEGRGLEPDVPVRCKAADLAVGKDTVLEAAREYLVILTSRVNPHSRPSRE